MMKIALQQGSYTGIKYYNVQHIVQNDFDKIEVSYALFYIILPSNMPFIKMYAFLLVFLR